MIFRKILTEETREGYCYCINCIFLNFPSGALKFEANTTYLIRGTNPAAFELRRNQSISNNCSISKETEHVNQLLPFLKCSPEMVKSTPFSCNRNDKLEFLDFHEIG